MRCWLSTGRLAIRWRRRWQRVREHERRQSLYRRRELLSLHEQLIAIGCSVLPMNFYSGDQPEDKYIDLPPYKQEIHLKLLIEKFATTSFGLVLRKD